MENLDHDIIWIGNIVSAYSNTPRYLYRDEGDIIEFRTIKNHDEIGYLDKKLKVLYLNDRYKMQYKAIKRQIMHDYIPESVSEYIDVLWKGVK